MNIGEDIDFLNFHINKVLGAYYPPADLIALIDREQLALYSDLKPKYATSQLIKDTLAPFRQVYNFTTLISGYVIVPDTTFLDLLDIQIYFTISNRVVYAPVKLINEDERANRLNSQIDPVTITSPIGEQTAPRTFRLYPVGVYNGNVTYLRRPVAPVYGYNTISGRVIVYNSATSTDLEWRTTEHDLILIKVLRSIGINIGSQELQQWAEKQTGTNYLNQNRI